MALTHDAFRTVFWVAVIPASVSVTLLVLFVHEPEREPHRAGERRSLRGLVGHLPSRYWWLVAVAALFTLARFSEAFLILKTSAVGLPAAYAPLVLVVMNLVYALSAYPAGWLSDRVSRWSVLAVGSTLLIVADLVLAVSHSVGSALLGIAVWGLHMGLTQGLFAALVADASSAEQRGTAFGVFNLANGLALLVASALAGAIWDGYGASATFVMGAAITMAAGGAAVVLYGAGRLQPRRAASR